jgi:arginine/serine-rich splicing factor 17
VIKIPGQVASPGEIIEKLRKQSLPEELIQIKVIKNTLDFLRFEAEIENKIGIKNLLLKLDGCSIQLTSYMELIKVRVAEAKIAYPTRHEWDSFYSSNAQVFNDLKPSERPDTVHIQELPIKWFADKKLDPNKPSETIVRNIFGLFGEIRAVDMYD